jgi:hypothetical protein
MGNSAKYINDVTEDSVKKGKETIGTTYCQFQVL